MLESMGEVAPFIDPDVILALNWVFFIGSCITGLMLLFPTLISLKADGKIEWLWTIVFIPAFILDGLVVLVLLTRPTSGTAEDDSMEDGGEDDEATATSDPAPNSNAEEKKKQRAKEQKMRKLFSLLYFALFVSFQALLALKLDGNLGRTWWIVFAPWLIMEFFHFLDITATFKRDLGRGIPDLDESTPGELKVRPWTSTERMALLLDSHGFWVLRVIQVILLCLKLQGISDAAWGVVFLPTWVWGAIKLLSIFLMSRNPNGNPAKRMMIQSMITFFIFSAFFIYTTFGLLVRRLNSEDETPSAALILIPSFIITGLMFCCMGCCLPCMMTCVRKGLEDQMNQPEAPAIVSAHKRIQSGTDAPTTSAARV
jgi:hypothetical protein